MSSLPLVCGLYDCVFEKKNEKENIKQVIFKFQKFCIFQFNKIKDINKKKNYLNRIDLEATTIDNWKAIHYICRYSNPEIIQYLIDKGVDLEAKTNNGWRPIHFICMYSTAKMVRYIIDKGVDLEAETNNGWRPIHFICIYSKPEIKEYIIKFDIDLEATTNDGWNYKNCDKKNIMMYKVLREHPKLSSSILIYPPYKEDKNLPDEFKYDSEKYTINDSLPNKRIRKQIEKYTYPSNYICCKRRK